MDVCVRKNHKDEDHAVVFIYNICIKICLQEVTKKTTTATTRRRGTLGDWEVGSDEFWNDGGDPYENFILDSAWLIGDENLQII